jgi:uncharacterized membrane protein YeiH
MDDWIYRLDLIGTAVFAMAGVLSVSSKKIDLFGVLVVAMVSAMGGGTLRDLILDAHPVFWIGNPIYLYVAIVAALLTFYAAHLVKRIPPAVFLVGDAMGLAVFTVIGANKALNLGAPYVVVVMMGIMTGVVGGLVRDVICTEIPLVLRKEIYATASLLGGSAFVALDYFQAGHLLMVTIPIALVFLTRLIALYWRISLPVFEHH